MLAAKILAYSAKAGEGKTGFIGLAARLFAGQKDAGDRSPPARLRWSASAGRDLWQGRRPWLVGRRRPLCCGRASEATLKFG